MDSRTPSSLQDLCSVEGIATACLYGAVAALFVSAAGGSKAAQTVSSQPRINMDRHSREPKF